MTSGLADVFSFVIYTQRYMTRAPAIPTLSHCQWTCYQLLSTFEEIASRFILPRQCTDDHVGKMNDGEQLRSLFCRDLGSRPHGCPTLGGSGMSWPPCLHACPCKSKQALPCIRSGVTERNRSRQGLRWRGITGSSACPSSTA